MGQWDSADEEVLKVQNILVLGMPQHVALADTQEVALADTQEVQQVEVHKVWVPLFA
jgi:hypothetical protein